MDSSCIGSDTPEQLRVSGPFGMLTRRRRFPPPLTKDGSSLPHHSLSAGELQQRLLTVVGQAALLHLSPSGDADDQLQPGGGGGHDTLTRRQP
ncbi:hypothetical protein NHX12_009614 [Muraenolepis orangiensis]|uniref:Uncharacterized protein n=1 Tax=Muraenolepis orangiensis TaxID=630683 RepID=A0A9Q0I831_9TELE|nr:hypothetical protein NHX12_009614 [Muraenolepis orangiensis]